MNISRCSICMDREEVVKDYIAGMTDRYAISVYKSLFVPTGWQTDVQRT